MFLSRIACYLVHMYTLIYMKLKTHMRNLNPKTRISQSALIHPTVTMCPENGWVVIGNDSTVNDFCAIHGGGGVRIGNGVRIGCRTVIHTVSHHFERTDVPIWKQGVYAKPILIEDDVWIGANCMILGGVKIGAHSVVGAHSLVTKDIP